VGSQTRQCSEEESKSLIRYNWQVRSLTFERGKLQRREGEKENTVCAGERELEGWEEESGELVRIHAVLASPQQLHQYCIQLRNWQRSSVLHFHARPEKENNSHDWSAQSAAGGALCKGQSTHTYNYTLSNTLWNLCCSEKQKKRAEEGHISWEYSDKEGQSLRGTVRTLVVICYHAPQGKLSSREFDRISAHLLHAHW